MLRRSGSSGQRWFVRENVVWFLQTTSSDSRPVPPSKGSTRPLAGAHHAFSASAGVRHSESPCQARARANCRSGSPRHDSGPFTDSARIGFTPHRHEDRRESADETIPPTLGPVTAFLQTIETAPRSAPPRGPGISLPAAPRLPSHRRMPEARLPHRACCEP
jgi:hypothetical protein